MDHYEKFTAIAEKFGLSGTDLREFVEDKVKIAEEKDKPRKAEEKEDQHQKQIIEREQRAEERSAKRELEQLKNDNLKLQIDLESRGHSNDTNEKVIQKDPIKVRKYDCKKEKNGCLPRLL